MAAAWNLLEGGGGVNAALYRVGSYGGSGYDSPARTPKGGRPGSGKGRAVQALVDAVRSKDDGVVISALEYLRLPTGGYAGEGFEDW